MWRNTGVMLVLTVSLTLAGCGKPSTPAASGGGNGGPPDQATGPTAQTPDGAVTLFLDAVCAGNDEGAANMLTDVARRKTAEMDLEVAPPGSDTAQFRIGQVENLSDGAARVACFWSDLDEQGDRTEERILWVLRREDAGWRIAGMAPTIFPDEPPLLLNFEDPEEMIQKLEWVQQEAMRRAQAELLGGEGDAALGSRTEESAGKNLRR